MIITNRKWYGKNALWPKPHLLHRMWWARPIGSEVWLILIWDVPPSSGIWWPRAVLHQVSFTFCHLVFSYWRGKSYIHHNAGDMTSWKLSNLCTFKFLLFLLLCLLFHVIFVVLLYTITHAQQEQQQNYIVTTTRIRTKELSNSCRLMFLLLFFLLFL